MASNDKKVMFTIETVNDNGSGIKYYSKNEFLTEISRMVDDALLNGCTFIDFQCDSDASFFANNSDE